MVMIKCCTHFWRHRNRSSCDATRARGSNHIFADVTQFPVAGLTRLGAGISRLRVCDMRTGKDISTFFPGDVYKFAVCVYVRLILIRKGNSTLFCTIVRFWEYLKGSNYSNPVFFFQIHYISKSNNDQVITKYNKFVKTK